MSQSMPSDGDLTSPAGSDEPKLNTRALEGETVKGINTGGKEFKLSEILKGDSPVFNKLSTPEKPSIHKFKNFDVMEMPGSNDLKAVFAFHPAQGLDQELMSKANEYFGVQMTNFSDVVAEFPYVIELTDTSVIPYTLEILKTLDSHFEELKKGA
jgi:hypothetical protein